MLRISFGKMFVAARCYYRSMISMINLDDLTDMTTILKNNNSLFARIQRFKKFCGLVSLDRS